MKILRISLCNLASLAGTHTVDFTRDPLRTAGLFSISGATGSGKSTLLDAMCLALYDATPRLKQVGRLFELANGDRPNDPRSLLRRGTAEGFAEVAFLGVDQQAYTARWSVRRSRRSAEGALQQSEMALYRGHIPPGTEGVVEEGGNKRQVQQAIEAKVGLTFEQFTRAVLLAQNDFATFLKANDRERAEILQALTGTERFEEISRSIFIRCGAEQKVVDSLRAQLAGNSPLSEDARAVAEAHHESSSKALHELETRRQILQSYLTWFADHRTLLDDQAKAAAILAETVAQNEASSVRRQELAITEEISRDSRPLRTAEQQAIATYGSATSAVEDSRVRCEQLREQNAAASERQSSLSASHESLTVEFKSLQPILQRARELDTTLRHMTAECDRVAKDLKAAEDARQAATQNLKHTADERSRHLQSLTGLQRDRERLQVYLPLVPDGARWLDRIDALISAKAIVTSSSQSLIAATETLKQLEDRLQSEQISLVPVQFEYDSAVRLLTEARALESKIDVDQIARERERLNEVHLVLRDFFNQLKESHTLRSRLKEFADKIQELEDSQSLDATALERILAQELPLSENSIVTAKAQLELIQAAVDDHAKRLRITLQEGKECPVCGSIDHPYTAHAPEQDATVVKEAKKFVRDLEKKRDELTRQQTRLQTSIETRSLQTAELKLELAAAKDQMTSIVYASAGDPNVCAVLALDEDLRMPAVEQQLLKLNGDLRLITAKEQKARDAVQAARIAQEAKDSAEGNLRELTSRIQQLASEHDRQKVTVENAKSAEQNAIKVHAEENERLNPVWKILPAAKDEFELNPTAFRVSFQLALRDCADIERRLEETLRQIEKYDAAIRPLEEAHQACIDRLKVAAEFVREASEKRKGIAEERLQIFDGRPAEQIEREWTARLESAARLQSESTTQFNELERLLAAAMSELQAKSIASDAAKNAMELSSGTRTRWMEEFKSRHSRTLTVEELDAFLARDFNWIQSERESLRQLDEAVSSAQGAANVRAELLQKHLAAQPTQEEESAIQADVEQLAQKLIDAKTEFTESQSVLRIDDDRRKKNEQLLQEIAAQDAKADPWRKLNDLLGSADGAKFRMIAQRTTLDVLLTHANYQLSHLASRYSLERISESLNLIIVDRDMGDERRSVHSLSGGESFLVSLALALGLASLTSNQVRIESLFIDEGFGSLDPDTLTTAMNALMQLESQGRKVGVISHVTEMTDAIPVQIQVVKGRRGASKIAVPGNQPQCDDQLGISAVGSAILSTRSIEPKSPLADLSPARVEDIALQMLKILQREKEAGKNKVSNKALRDELQCDAAIFKKAQVRLKDEVETEGRSVSLRSAPDA